MRLLFIVLLALSFKIVRGQSCECSSADDYITKLKEGLILVEYKNPVEGHTGEQFFNDWKYGEVTMANGDVIKDIAIRYDRYSDALLYLRKGDYKKGVFSKSMVSGFSLYDQMDKVYATFVRKRVNLPWVESSEVYLQYLAEGEFSLYAYRNVNVPKVDFKLVDNTKYLIEKGGEMHRVILRRKSLLELPFIDRELMKDVLRKSGVSLMNNEAGFITAITLYNDRLFKK